MSLSDYRSSLSEPTLLIVDDEKPTREGLRKAFEDQFDVYVADGYESAVNLLDHERIDLVLTDLKLGGKGGMDVLKYCQKLSNAPLCFLMTAYGSVDVAVKAMKLGAYDYATKPLNLDKLEMMLLRAFQGRQAIIENQSLKQQLDDRLGLERLIGNSEAMENVFNVIRQVAPSRATVLIQGESGTGKELAAQAIHSLSPRKEKIIKAVHCAALSPQLLESELFGHEKGAFTGAFEKRIGRFEEADGGTLFLDEIGEIDEQTQVKLLRVLGERKFERVGGNKVIETDVRVIAATNKNLKDMVEAGEFREDLYYRINVVTIDMPPLRNRLGDIPLLVKSFLADIGEENEKPGIQLSEAAEKSLLQYDWPGNVRELRTAIEHGIVLSRTSEIQPGDLPASIVPATDQLAQAATTTLPTLNLADLERVAIIRSLEETGDNKTLAAERLGISRRTLHRKINEYRIDI
ncbi:MAG: sigma-54 dependent transcriptional regulator [Verrucomicrobiota bacterium]